MYHNQYIVCQQKRIEQQWSAPNDLSSKGPTTANQDIKIYNKGVSKQDIIIYKQKREWASANFKDCWGPSQ